MALLAPETRQIADRRFAELGLRLSFGKHIDETDDFGSSRLESRLEDLREAFLDPEIKAVITVIGGFSSNQLLKYLDWEAIAENPKIFCGYSDITVLNNAMWAKTGLVTYYGPHYSSFGQKSGFAYTLKYFQKCLMNDGAFAVLPSESWSDDRWYQDQEHRNFTVNSGWKIINPGSARGTIIGGNLCTFNLLQGSEFFPGLNNDTVLFLEDDDLAGGFSAYEFDRNLQSVINLPQFDSVRGLVVGRFPRSSEMNTEKFCRIVKSKAELRDLPVLAEVDFGHTDPKITFPIGGEVALTALNTEMKLELLKH